MKETIWISVPTELDNVFEPWQNHVSFRRSGAGTGDITVYKLHVGSSAYDGFSAVLSERCIPSRVDRREYSFTKAELLQAEIVRFAPQEMDDSESVCDQRVCPGCRETMPPVYTRGLSALPGALKKRDIVSTYVPNRELIVSDRMRSLLESYSNAYSFDPVFHLRHRDRVIPGYSQLRVPVGIGRVVDPTIVERGELCPECGLYSKFLCLTLLYFERETWSGLPLCYTQDFFGGSPKRFEGRKLIASREFYRSLLEHRMTGFWVTVPAYLV